MRQLNVLCKNRQESEELIKLLHEQGIDHNNFSFEESLRSAPDIVQAYTIFNEGYWWFNFPATGIPFEKFKELLNA